MTDNNLPAINPVMDLISKAIEKGTPAEVVSQILDLQERVKKSEAEELYRTAMAKLQAEMPIIKKETRVKGKDNKDRYAYAKIENIVKQVGKLISDNGFSYDVDTEVITSPFEGQKAILNIHHIAGQSKRFTFNAPIEKGAFMSEPQKWLSAASFAKRVVFCNGFGIMTADDDNDGNTGDPPANHKTPITPEQQKTINDNQAKLDRLPEDIKEGFTLLGYRAKAQFMICDERDWNNERIKKRINELLDKGKR